MQSQELETFFLYLVLFLVNLAIAFDDFVGQPQVSFLESANGFVNGFLKPSAGTAKPGIGV